MLVAIVQKLATPSGSTLLLFDKPVDGVHQKPMLNDSIKTGSDFQIW